LVPKRNNRRYCNEYVAFQSPLINGLFPVSPQGISIFFTIPLDSVARIHTIVKHEVGKSGKKWKVVASGGKQWRVVGEGRWDVGAVLRATNE